MRQVLLTIAAVIVLACLSGVSLAASAISIIVAGQSNAVGYGALLPQDLLSDAAPIIVLTPEAGIRDSQEPWRAEGAGIYASGSGVGRSFARYITSHDASVNQIWMINCARGGTKISEWQPGSDLMEGCLTLATRAASLGAPVSAIVWMQGETDSLSMSKAGPYGFKLRRTVAGFRAGVGEVPFLMSGLPDNVPEGVMPYRYTVDAEARAALAALPLTAFVETSDLNLMVPGSVHWERGSLRAIGNRLAAALLELKPYGLGVQ